MSNRKARIYTDSGQADQKLVQQALVDLEKAWQAVMPVKIALSTHESNPQFAMVVTTSKNRCGRDTAGPSRRHQP